MFHYSKLQHGSVPMIVLLVFVLAVILGGIFYMQKNEPRIGGDTDEHGCLIAAGYSWCEAKNKCIRQWEEYCTNAVSKEAVFVCSDAKTITATFYPEDDKFVDLMLSNEMKISVPHATSASGARYAKEDESFVFWNKGDTVFITENGTTTFADCVLSEE